MEKTTLTLFITVMGISLLLVGTSLPSKEIHSEEELFSLIDNQKVMLSGNIILVTLTKGTSKIVLDSNISIQINEVLMPLIQGGKIQIEGVKESYEGKTFVQARTITLIP